MTAIKIIILILSLGMDTLLMAITLGMTKTTGRWKVALTFACFEALMPIVGIFIGKGLGQAVGHFTALIGGLALICVSVWLIFFEDDDDTDLSPKRVAGWTLIFTALSISVDELAVGFSIGLVGIPIVLTLILIALQAFCFSVLGLTFGSKLKPYLGEWAEKLAGVVLGLLGIWLCVHQFL